MPKKSGKKSSGGRDVFRMDKFAESWIDYYRTCEDDLEEKAAQKANSSSSIQIRDEKCSNSIVSRCNRKQKEGCSHSMCFQCCFALTSASLDGEDRKVCESHIPDVQAKEAEERYFEAGFNEHFGNVTASQRKKTRFYHYETQFDNNGETVLLWCLKDFARNKEFSEKTFAKHHEAVRRRRFRLRREGGGQVEETVESSYLLVPFNQRKAALEQGRERFSAWHNAIAESGGWQEKSPWLESFTKGVGAGAAKK